MELPVVNSKFRVGTVGGSSGTAAKVNAETGLSEDPITFVALM